MPLTIILTQYDFRGKGLLEALDTVDFSSVVRATEAAKWSIFSQLPRSEGG